MKKVAVFSFVVLAAISVAQGASLKPSKEPATEAKRGKKAEILPAESGKMNMENTIDKINFTADFGFVPNAVWKKSVKYNEVTFNKNGNLLTAYYNNQGDLIGTTSDRKFSDLPGSAQREIKSRYKDYRIGDVIFFEDANAENTDGMIYGVKFQYPGNYFLEVNRGESRLILEVNPEGNVFLYKEL